VNDDGIAELRSRSGKVVRIRWSEVISAILRERRNAARRDDRLLVIQSRTAKIDFVTSTLTEEDEAQVLAMVDKHTRLVRAQDRGFL
jgi:hypothetical protein